MATLTALDLLVMSDVYMTNYCLLSYCHISIQFLHLLPSTTYSNWCDCEAI